MIGKTWKFGNDISTDHITPGTLNTGGNLSEICFAYERPKFSKYVGKGDYILGGENFGAGSSRETAPQAIQQCGIEAVLAKSFARIFRDNSINIGLYAIVVPEEAYEAIQDGDTIFVDTDTSIITIDNQTFQGDGPTGIALDMIKSGGRMAYLKERNWSYRGKK